MYYLQTKQHTDDRFSKKFINTYYGDSSSNKRDTIADATPIETLERAKTLKDAYELITKCEINIITLTPTIVAD